MTRIAEVRRDTKETQIHVRVDLDGTGRAALATGIGFLGHPVPVLVLVTVWGAYYRRSADRASSMQHG